jgi:hypothetical protein
MLGVLPTQLCFDRIATALRVSCTGKPLSLFLLRRSIHTARRPHATLRGAAL